MKNDANRLLPIIFTHALKRATQLIWRMILSDSFIFKKIYFLMTDCYKISRAYSFVKEE